MQGYSIIRPDSRFLPDAQDPVPPLLDRLSFELHDYVQWLDWAAFVARFWGSQRGATSIQITPENRSWRVREVHVLDPDGRELEPDWDLEAWGEWTEDRPRPAAYADYLKGPHLNEAQGVVSALDTMEAPYPDQTATLSLQRPAAPTLEALLPNLLTADPTAAWRHSKAPSSVSGQSPSRTRLTRRSRFPRRPDHTQEKTHAISIAPQFPNTPCPDRRRAGRI